MKATVCEPPRSRTSTRRDAAARRDACPPPKSREALKWWCVACADEWFARGEQGAARDFLKHAADLDPTDDRIWIALGSVHYLLGEWAEAGMAFLRAVRLRPGNARAWLHLALAHERMDQPGLALLLVRQARELDPADEAVRVAWERLETRVGGLTGGLQPEPCV